jgi:uncharacterized linocin/CFP29 family protein
VLGSTCPPVFTSRCCKLVSDHFPIAAGGTARSAELRVPFELERQAIDDVDRGANDSDWQPLKEAAKRIAFAEDRAIFEGYAAAGIQGIRQGTSNPIRILPSDVVHYPDAIAEALSPSVALTPAEKK